MKPYIITRTRDGQQPERWFDLGTDDYNQAVDMFTQKMLSKVADSNDYGRYNDEEQLNEVLPDYEFEGDGYYLHPDSVSFGRQDFYPAQGAKMESYREDVYSYSIAEGESEF